jgi:hypothetical protein
MSIRDLLEAIGIAEPQGMGARLNSEAGTWSDLPTYNPAVKDLGRFVLGGLWPHPHSDATRDSCDVCSGDLALDPRDRRILASDPTIKKCCARCFFTKGGTA